MSIWELLSVSKGKLTFDVLRRTPEQGKLGRRHRNPSTRAVSLLHRQPVRHDGFFGICRTTAGGRTFWRRKRHTQKRLQAWIGDACKRRLFRSAPRRGAESNRTVKQRRSI